MKYLSNILSLLLLALLSACNDDSMPELNKQDLPEGTPVDMLVTADVPELVAAAGTRAMSDQPTADDLKNNLKINLLMFDEAGVMLQFIEPKDISISNVDAATGKVSFRVHNIYSSTQPRRLHFVVTSAPDLRNINGGEYISAMASETTVMPALLTTGNTDAYWGMQELNEINEDTRVDIKLIRNFVKLSVTTDPSVNNFKLLGYTVVNRPNKGTVAPYIYKDRLFASFLSPEDALLSYDQLIKQGYHGVNPAGVESDMLCTTEAEVQASLTDSENRLKAGEADTPYYFYERSQSNIAAISGDAPVTYVIVVGEYNGNRYYYKIDIGQETDGKFKFYDLLRNFCYTVNITQVGGEGAATLQEALNGVPNNNISASVVTRDLFSIGYDNEIIVVSATSVIFTEKTTNYELRFRYTMPDGVAFEAEKLKIYDLNNENTEYNAKDHLNTTIEDLSGDVVQSAYLTTSTEGTTNTQDDWYVLRITTNDLPSDVRRLEQNLRIYYKGSAGLGRTVTLMLRQPWVLSDMTSTNPTDARNSEFSIKFKVPEGMSKAMFPLILTFESDKQNIYAKNGTELSVNFGKSGFKGATTDNVMSYEWRLEWEKYNPETGVVFEANFLTNTTSADDEAYNTAGMDAATNGNELTENHRTDNNESSNFCIRISNKGRKYIEPTYVNIDRSASTTNP